MAAKVNDLLLAPAAHSKKIVATKIYTIGDQRCSGVLQKELNKILLAVSYTPGSGI